MNTWKTIHEATLECATSYKNQEAQLIDRLQEVDAQKVYEHLGVTSLFSYCIEVLKLSEDWAYSLIRVARKSVEVPELKVAVSQGELSVAAAKRIAAVITPENKTEWIEKAKELKQRDLDRAIAEVSPATKVTEKVKPVALDLFEFRCPISKALEEKLRRVKEVLAQKQQRSASMSETLEALADSFLEKHDPVRKAQRAEKRKPREQVSKPVGTIPARVRHEVNRRDGGQCTYVHPEFGRCRSRQWLDFHHIHQKSRGGLNETNNLTTLCSAHHRMGHRTEVNFVKVRRIDKNSPFKIEIKNTPMTASVIQK
jgi:5-methylcytosine-specific restriction endonuclease McrA